MQMPERPLHFCNLVTQKLVLPPSKEGITRPKFDLYIARPSHMVLSPETKWKVRWASMGFIGLSILLGGKFVSLTRTMPNCP